MSPALRTTFAIGFVLSAISSAEAGSRSMLEVFPTTANLPSSKPAPVAPAPSVQPPAPGPASVVAAKADARGRGRGRRTRYARSQPAHPVEPDAAAPNAAVTQAISATVAPSANTMPKPADTRAALPLGQEPAAKTPAETRPDTNQAVETASPTLATLIAKHAAAAGVPVGLAQAVVRIESRGNARASHAGALGLMQIKAGTARAAGFMGNASGLLDADTNLRFGMKVLADAYRGAGGDVCRALMKYQSGHLATHMTRANRTYCSKARAFMAGL